MPEIQKSTATSYALDNTQPQAEQRFSSLEALFDPGTIRQLEAIGVDAGWNCLEVGGGGGSIARWRQRASGQRATSP